MTDEPRADDRTVADPGPASRAPMTGRPPISVPAISAPMKRAIGDAPPG